MGRNIFFEQAKRDRNDEFYTLYEDIERDLRHYEKDFSGKTIYCPCDDYRKSNFIRYFKRNFHRLHLKALLASNYNIGEGAFKYKYDGTFEIAYPIPTGDFRTDEIEPMLRACDMIVTNPPFSLLRAFFDRIKPYGKDILIVAPLNAAAYSNIFPYIANGSLKADCKWRRDFDTPGRKRKVISNQIYLTTLTPEKHYLEGSQVYSPAKYPKYDNYDAIEVKRSKDIPIDYYGEMGVPISFLKWYDPREWELLAAIEPTLDGKDLFKRLLLRRRTQ